MPRIALATAATCFCLSVSVAHAQQHSDADFCRVMQDFAGKANSETGRMVDTVTVDMGMAVLCKLKSVDFKKRVEVSFSTFKAGWQARKQAQWNQLYCKSGSASRRAIEAGWKISHTMIDTDGQRHYMEATCR